METVVYHQGNKLFRELEGPIVVGTAGDVHRQLKGIAVGLDKQVGTGLAGRVGTVRIQGRSFGKEALGPQRAVYLICGNLQVFDAIPVYIVSCRPVPAGQIQQVQCAQNIGSGQWERAGKSSDSTGWGYRLCWFDEYGSCIEDIVVSGSGQIQWNGYFYTAKGAAINTSLLDELLYQYSV